jgi:putative membrane protein
MKLLTRWLLITLTLLIVATYVPGIEVSGLYPALVATAILGLLNAIVRPILVILTFPITVLTLGLFVIVINAGLFWFAASFIDGFYVDSFWYAVLGSLIVSLVSATSNRLLK